VLVTRSPRASHVPLATATVFLVLMITGCGAGSYSSSEPEVSEEAVGVDPVKTCGMLVAMPRGLAQEKAAEYGCVEVGDNKWKYQANAPAEAAPAPVEPAPVVESQPGGGISWNQAASYAGTTQRVCGPLAGGGNSDDDVFLNLGYDYPHPNRFQIVVWDIGSLEPIAGGLTLCTSGVITLYEGVAQIELRDPGMIEIYS